MPIDINNFKEGTAPVRRKLQINIMLVLQKNPNKAFSSIEFENLLNARRQAINQALRSLEQKGMVKRAYIKDGHSKVTYVTIEEAYRGIDVSVFL